MTEERMPLKQRRDLSQIIETAFTLYARNFWPLYSIAAVVIPLGIASAVLQVAIDDDLATAIVITSLSLLQIAVSVLAVAAIVAALGDIDAGRPAEFSHAYDVAFERFWTLLGALLRVVAIVLLLFITILGIPWAIQRSVRWLFVQQAVILDRTSARAALSYSADAVSGSWWRTFGIMILLTVIVQIPAQIISAPFALAPPLVSGTVSSSLSALALPLSAIGMTLLYFDLKARRQAVAAEL
ncbi:MAG: hypothetical protein IH959_03025 [Chloroflexi bacterium]|nr:hypothetical protein [Chloroflexota bacterium]